MTMTENDFYLLAAILLLLVLSFFFSGSETALTATSRSRMHQQAKNGEERATTVLTGQSTISTRTRHAAFAR